METLIALKILKLAPNSEIPTPRLPICAFCSLSNEVPVLCRDWEREGMKTPVEVMCWVALSTRWYRWLQVGLWEELRVILGGPGVGRRDLLLWCSHCNGVAPTQVAPGPCALLNPMQCSLRSPGFWLCASFCQRGNSGNSQAPIRAS